MLLTETGHVKLATEMFDEDYRLGWGTLPLADEWGQNPIPEDLNSIIIISEVGRIKSQVKTFVYPLSTGIIDVDGIKWEVSPTPTKFIYLKFVFQQTMNSGDDIFQVGVFTNTVPAVGFEAAEYLQPSQILETGNLVLLENQPVVYRNDATKEIFEFVLTF